MQTGQPQRATIAHLIAEPKLIWGHRRACGREQDILPGALALHRSYEVLKIGRGIRCSAGGIQRVETKPELYPGVVEVMRKWSS